MACQLKMLLTPLQIIAWDIGRVFKACLQCVGALKDLFYEGLEFFEIALLKDRRIFESNGYVYIVPWMGDKIVNTITTMLIKSGYTASAFAGVIEVENASQRVVSDCLRNICSENSLTNTELATSVSEKSIEKYDDYLSERLLTEGYGQKYFDVKSTIAWINSNL